MTKKAVVPVPEFALEAIGRSGAALASAARGVSEGTTEPVEGVHELRVSIRRVRAQLRIFAGVFDAAWLEAMQTQLRDLGRVVGETRDLDVIHGRLEQLAAGLPATDRAGIAPVLAQLALDRSAAHDRACAAVGNTSRASVVDDLTLAPNRWPLAADAAQVDLADLVTATRLQWRRLRKAAAAAEADLSVEKLHLVRIRAKTLRYSLETLEPLLHSSARDHAKALVSLQDHLGKMQDAEVIERWLRVAVETHRGDAFVVGQLVGLERARKERARATWDTPWQRAAQRKLRRWAR